MKKLTTYLNQNVSIAPLAVFRVIFGLMMLISILRFVAYNWIEQFYIKPVFYFPFLGFEWIKPLGAAGMYILFFVMGLSALLIMIGLFYRIASILFFLSFTYVEMIDKTYYLNHYYFISIVAFLMILLPAHRYFSLDAVLFPSIRSRVVPRWTITTIKLQLGIVYFFAGVAKINYEWLILAQPLSIWMPANTDLPVIGFLLDETVVVYLFAWFGCIYDLFIPFFLLNPKTRVYAYITVVVFHVMTRMMFNIGMFPWIMILSTLIFFPADFHEKIIQFFKKLSIYTKDKPAVFAQKVIPVWKNKIILSFLALHFFVQVVLPLRYLLYPSGLFWHEEGFRFSWRVMLMEKGGTTLFYVSDENSSGEIEIDNRKYLTQQQEKMMSTQPDMILQFAHFIKSEYTGKKIVAGNREVVIKNPKVRVWSYVNLNGEGSRQFIDPTVNLASKDYNLKHRDWVLPYE